MEMIKSMINGFRKQTKNTIWKYLAALTREKYCYSIQLEDECRLLKNKKVYVFATGLNAVIVCMEHYPMTDELADEEPFNMEEPLYFTESGHRISPVWQLSETLKVLQDRLAQHNYNNVKLWGVLLTDSHIINREDMEEVWDNMHVTVIDQLHGIVGKQLAVNSDEELEAKKMVDAMMTPADNEVDDEEFDQLLNDFINSSDDDDDDDGDDDLDFDDDESGSGPFSDILLPDGKIEQNTNVSVQVTILPPIENPREELSKLVGCQDIKKRMDELLALTRYNRMRHECFPDAKLHEVSLHSVFLGRPGTGKTTVCKIFGSLLREAGALSKGHVVVCNRGTFIGTLWGDEERAMRQVVEKAQGGVLMIDEAYLLNGKHDHDPGKMVIQLLMDVLADEQQRDIAVVLCGYKEPMMRLLESNPGLHSRFPNHFEFSDFTVDELLEITRRRIDEYKYHFTRSGWGKFKQVVNEAYQVRDPATWGNARFIANQLERIYIEHACRCVRHRPADKRQMQALTPADIKPIELPRQKPHIGF